VTLGKAFFLHMSLSLPFSWNLDKTKINAQFDTIASHHRRQHCTTQHNQWKSDHSTLDVLGLFINLFSPQHEFNERLTELTYGSK
jgi:hypothetical protein